MRIGSLDVWTPRIREIVRAHVPEGFTIRFAESYDPAEQMQIAGDIRLPSRWLGRSAGEDDPSPRRT